MIMANKTKGKTKTAYTDTTTKKPAKKSKPAKK